MIILAGNGNKGNVTVQRSHNCDCSMGHTVTALVSHVVTRRQVTIVTCFGRNCEGSLIVTVTGSGKVTVTIVGELHLTNRIPSRAQKTSRI